MLDRPRVRTLWHVPLLADDIARELKEAPDAVRRWLETANGREVVRRRLAEHFGIPADRLNVRTGGVRVGEVWIEVPVAGGWVAAARLTIQAGRLVIAELRVFPQEETAFRRKEPGGRWSGEVLGVLAEAPAGGLTARKLGAVRLGQYPRHLREVMRWVAEKYGTKAFRPDGSLAALGLVAPTTERPRQRREFGRPDSFYAELAREYVRLVERRSRRPNAEIAARRRELVPKITGWLHEARLRGLLAPKDATQGRPEGRLTPLAERVLRQADRSPARRTFTEKGVGTKARRVATTKRRGRSTR